MAGLLACFCECSKTDLAIGDEKERGKVVKKAVPGDSTLWVVLNKHDEICMPYRQTPYFMVC